MYVYICMFIYMYVYICVYIYVAMRQTIATKQGKVSISANFNREDRQGHNFDVSHKQQLQWGK